MKSARRLTRNDEPSWGTVSNCRDGPMTLGCMSDFDKLPVAVREALRKADHNWSGTQCLRELRKPKGTRRIINAAHAVQVIRDVDAKRHITDTSDPDFVGVMPGQRQRVQGA
jgi:hypothetical protein